MFQRGVLTHPKLEKADRKAILNRYPSLASEVYEMQPVPFDNALLPRRVQDPCPVKGSLPFLKIGEEYRVARKAESEKALKALEAKAKGKGKGKAVGKLFLRPQETVLIFI